MQSLKALSRKYDCVVFTYNVPHRKTYDVLTLLKASGYQDVMVYAVPMHYKKKHVPLYVHRPSAIINIHPSDLSNGLGYDYFEGEDYERFYMSINVPILICGAGILPQQVVKYNNVINAHPGLIPKSRGLDALKWAIVEDSPIGVTTHFLGDEVDAGIIIKRCIIPVYKNDTFHAVAQRVYENEVRMLVEAIDHVSDEHEYISEGDSILHRRMPVETEKELMLKFEIYKEKHSVDPE